MMEMNSSKVNYEQTKIDEKKVNDDITLET